MSDNSDMPKKPRTRRKAELSLATIDGKAVERIRAKRTIGIPEVSKLTFKQEAFCRNLANGMTQADAYRSAYDAEGMADGTVWSKASVLAAQEKVAARVREIVKARDSLTQHEPSQVKAKVIARLLAVLDDPNAKPAEQMKAAELLGRWGEVALFNDQVTVKQETMSPEDAVEAIKAKLAKLKAG